MAKDMPVMPSIVPATMRRGWHRGVMAIKSTNAYSVFKFTKTANNITGVLDFIGPYEEKLPLSIDPELILSALKLTDRAAVDEAIRTTGFRTGIEYIDSEIADLGSRFGKPSTPSIIPVGP
jgi:hypothetical protein